jgi:hypothetical protein
VVIIVRIPEGQRPAIRARRSSSMQCRIIKPGVCHASFTIGS